MLLEHFNLTQVILSADLDERELGVELSLLLYRYDANTKLSDITPDRDAQQVLSKKEAKDVWQKLSARAGGGKGVRFAS